MLLQETIEHTIHQLMAEFIAHPFLFFTEADAVVRFHQLLEQKIDPLGRATSQDGFEVPLIHREYPTFFRFDDKNPTKRLPKPARRGHYDTVILNPEFIKTHPIETVHNRNIKTEAKRIKDLVPLQAVIEFKLDNLGWSAGRSEGVRAELGKLALTEEATLRYFVVLMRYQAPSNTRWEKYWPKVDATLRQFPDINSLVAIYWLTMGKGNEVHLFGNWKVGYNHATLLNQG